jgi:hypothetical protein
MGSQTPAKGPLAVPCPGRVARSVGGMKGQLVMMGNQICILTLLDGLDACRVGLASGGDHRAASREGSRSRLDHHHCRLSCKQEKRASERGRF